MIRLLAFLVFLCAAVPARADIVVRFFDGTPEDLITIRNEDVCETGPISVTIDLRQSAGGLFFDTTAGGAGFSEWQPFRVVGGTGFVDRLTPVSDGTQVLTIAFRNIPPNGLTTITTDLDDALPGSPTGPTIVDGAEIAGALVSLTVGEMDTPVSEARFDVNSTATVPLSVCIS